MPLISGLVKGLNGCGKYAPGLFHEFPVGFVDVAQQLFRAALVALTFGPPVGSFWSRALYGAQPVTLHLGPDVGLGPVNPGAAHFQGTAQLVIKPGAPADPVACFKDDDGLAGLAEFTGSGETGEARADDDDVGLLSGGVGR